MHDFYLAGPMRGHKNGNKEELIRVANLLRKRGLTVWNPAEQNDTGKSFAECIKNDLSAIMYECEAIALLPGWLNSLGVNIEAYCGYVCAKDFVNVVYMPDGQIEIATLSKADLMKDFRLPFGGDKTNTRRTDELEVPEEEVFNANE